jgi:hypothetical protein
LRHLPAAARRFIGLVCAKASSSSEVIEFVAISVAVMVGQTLLAVMPCVASLNAQGREKPITATLVPT